ncbi:MAG TPA: phosphotransferase [Microbacterium sp.]|nr:phosphotransferase [Microbacterium sp.]
MPEVVAFDESGRWLLLGDGGEAIGFDADLSTWIDVLPQYAVLQEREVATVAEHLARGVPDRRLERFPALYDDVLDRALPVGPEVVGRLRGFRERFVSRCDELNGYGIPATVQHDDLHGGNVHRQGETTRILDWGDACISHPFLTLYVTFIHLDEVMADDRLKARLRDAYLGPWGPNAELRDAFDLACRLGPFAHLFKELRVLDAVPLAGRALLVPDLPAILQQCVSEIERSENASGD